MHCDSSSLAYIYKSIGALHSLQPGPQNDGYSSPNIPALKPKGFVTWQTIQLLLEPEIHVPYLQKAVQQWDIIDPREKKPFPKVLPRAAFPERPNAEMVAWYDNVSRRLEQEAQERERRQRETHKRNGDPVVSPGMADPRSVTSHKGATSPPDTHKNDFGRAPETEYFTRTDYQDASGRPARRSSRTTSYQAPSYPTHEKEKDKERKRSFAHGVRHLFRSHDLGSSRRKSEAERHSHRPFTSMDEDDDYDDEHLHARWTPSRAPSPPQPPRPRSTHYRSNAQNDEYPYPDYHYAEWDAPQYSSAQGSRQQNARRKSRSRSRDQTERRDSALYPQWTSRSVPSSPPQDPSRHTSKHRRRRTRSRPTSPISLADSDSDVEEIPREVPWAHRPEPRQRVSHDSSTSERNRHSPSAAQQKRYSAPFSQGHSSRHHHDGHGQAPFSPILQPEAVDDGDDFRQDRRYHSYQRSPGTPPVYSNASTPQQQGSSDISSSNSSPNPGLGFAPSKGPLFASVLNQRNASTPQPVSNNKPVYAATDRERRSSYSHVTPPKQRELSEPMRRAASVRYVSGSMWAEESKRYEEERRRERKIRPGTHRYGLKEGVALGEESRVDSAGRRWT